MKDIVMFHVKIDGDHCHIVVLDHIIISCVWLKKWKMLWFFFYVQACKDVGRVAGWDGLIICGQIWRGVPSLLKKSRSLLTFIEFLETGKGDKLQAQKMRQMKKKVVKGEQKPSLFFNRPKTYLLYKREQYNLSFTRFCTQPRIKEPLIK